MIQADLNIILPEVILSLYAMLGLVGAVYSGKDKLAPLLVWLTAGLFALLAFWIAGSTGPSQTAFGGMLVDDGFARFSKITILICGGLMVTGSIHLKNGG